MRPVRTPSIMRWQKVAGTRSSDTPMKEASSCLKVMSQTRAEAMHLASSVFAGLASVCFLAATDTWHPIATTVAVNSNEIRFFNPNPLSREQSSLQRGQVNRMRVGPSLYILAY